MCPCTARGLRAAGAEPAAAAEAALQALTQPVLLPILNETLAEPTRTAGTLIKHKTFVDLMDLDGWAWFTTPERIAAVVRPFLDEA